MRFIGVIAICVLIAGSAAYWKGKTTPPPVTVPLLSSPSPDVPGSESVSPVPDRETVVDNQSFPESPETKNISPLITSVPFTSQAPFGEWNDPIFQNGCEEATLTMVHFFLIGKPLSREAAKKEIIALSMFAKRRFGHFVDTSAEDTLRLFREYYGYSGGVVEYAIDGDDVRAALRAGDLVIVPVDGRRLKNPHFRQPGPATHMLLVVGYDAETKEFVTNDPGTRYGAGYRYSETTLIGAIRDYPTGDHSPISGVCKAMIVIPKG